MAVSVVRGTIQRKLLASSDAGKTWTEATMLDGVIFNFKAGFDFASFVPPSSIYLFSKSNLKYSSDLGQSWGSRGQLSNTIAGKMFSHDFGYRVVSTAGEDLRLSTDSGYMWVDRLSEWPSRSRHTALIDSNNIWRVTDEVLYRSWDKGVTWQSMLPYDTMTNDLTYRFLLPSSDTNRYYVIGGVRDRYDYLVTTDGGVTWSNVSPNTGGRITLIAEQSPSQMWLGVSREPAFPSPDLYSQSDAQMTDTLFYSSDSGRTWSKDLSFVGDTITELQFTTPDRGYVVSMRDSAVILSCYRSSVQKVDLNSSRHAEKVLTLYPNPAKEQLRFQVGLSGNCRVRILDVLGRSISEIERDLQFMEFDHIQLPSNLPAGCYWFEITKEDSRIGERFLVAH